MLNENLKIRRRITRYFEAYCRELRAQTARFAANSAVIPQFLQDNAYVTSVVALDGVMTLFRRDRSDVVKTLSSVERILQLAKSPSRFDPGWPIEFANFSVRSADISKLQFSNSYAVEGVDVSGNVVSWVRVDFASRRDDDRWSADLAASKAANDVLSFIAGALMRLPPAPTAVDERALVTQRLESLIREFQTLLNQDPPEEILQQFLANNPVALEPTAMSVIPKLKLGNDFITDFVQRLGDDEYVLVELEQSSYSLFTKSGDPRSQLTHAIRQVSDWREWVAENLQYARKSLEGIRDPRCWVIIGRRKSLSPDDRNALARLNTEHPNIRIITYDDLIDRMKHFVMNLKGL